MVTRTQPALIYDGDCAFCTRCVRFIEQNMSSHTQISAYQEVPLESFGLSADQCRRAVQWVDVDGQVRSGNRAVAAVCRSAGGAWWLIGVVGDFPGVRLIATGVYQLVARNRHRLHGEVSQSSRGPESH